MIVDSASRVVLTLTPLSAHAQTNRRPLHGPLDFSRVPAMTRRSIWGRGVWAWRGAHPSKTSFSNSVSSAAILPLQGACRPRVSPSPPLCSARVQVQQPVMKSFLGFAFSCECFYTNHQLTRLLNVDFWSDDTRPSFHGARATASATAPCTPNNGTSSSTRRAPVSLLVRASARARAAQSSGWARARLCLPASKWHARQRWGDTTRPSTG